MINLEISENKLKDFENSVGEGKLASIQEKFGKEIAVIAVALHTSKAADLLKLKEALSEIGWQESAVAVAAGGEAEVSIEPTEFEIVISSVKSDKKIAAIKALRSFTHEEASKLSLSDAKGLIDGVSDKHIVFGKYETKEKAEDDAKLLEGIAEISIQGV